MQIKDLILIVSALLGLMTADLRQIIFIGTDKKKFWSMEAKKNKGLIWNKQRHRTHRLLEFIIRSWVIWSSVLWSGMLSKLSGVMFAGNERMTQNETALIIAVAFYGLCIIVQISTFKNGLIGINMFSKRTTWEKIGLGIVNLLGFNMLYVSFWFREGQWGTTIWGAYTLIILTLLAILLAKLKKHTVYQCKTGSTDNDNIGVQLDRDIYVEFNNSDRKQINLLINNLYICDNDDILLISKPEKGKEAIIQRINKASIKYVSIKGIKIKYGDSQWFLVGN